MAEQEKKKRGNPQFVRAFGLHLQKLRNEKGLTQDDVSEKSGLNVRQVRRMELGERNSTISTAKQYADGLGVHVRELFDFDVEEAE